MGTTLRFPLLVNAETGRSRARRRLRHTLVLRPVDVSSSTLYALGRRSAPEMDVLQLDVSGRPQAWMTVKEAAILYACDAVAWTLGDPCHVMRGGVQRATGRQSRIEVHSIIAVR